MHEETTKDLLEKKFQGLPPVVQEVIHEAKVAESMQKVSKKYNLHLDQWQDLEYEVTMALYGITPVESLEANIIKHVGMEASLARELSTDIALIVFQPIREELERRLDHPEAHEKVGTPMEDMTAEILKGEQPLESGPVVAPNPTISVQPSAISESYKTGQPSAERKQIENDPYREPIS